MCNDKTYRQRVHALAERYSREAEAYRTLWAPALLTMIRAHLEQLETSGIRLALDVGTGVGTALPELRRRFAPATVMGVDRAMGMLACVPRDEVRACMDASALGFANRVFDLVVMAFVLFHLPEPSHGLLEARRVLRPGGLLVLTTWEDDAESTATRIWNTQLDAHGAATNEDLERLAHHELMDSTEKVSALLDAAGFVEARVERRSFTYPIAANDFVALKTNLGRGRERLDSLPEQVQRAFLAEVTRRFVALTPDDFTLHLPVILASAYTTH